MGMADNVHNRVAVEGPPEVLAAFFDFDPQTTPLEWYLPPPPDDELPGVVCQDSPLTKSMNEEQANESFIRIAGQLGYRFGLEQSVDQLASQSIRAWSPHFGDNHAPKTTGSPFVPAAERGDFSASPEIERNITRFGVPDGHTWRRMAWGSNRPEWDLRREGNALRFFSSWSPLLKGYLHLSLMFPDLLFRYVYLNQQSYEEVYVGYRIFQNGIPRAAKDKIVQPEELVPNYFDSALSRDREGHKEWLDAIQALEDEWWNLAHLG
jgi:hypothetical protein